MNKLLLTGNITKDARLNAVSDLKDAVSFTIAVNESQKNAATGEYTDVPTYYNVTRFYDKGQGDKVVGYLTKGREVSVEGSLQKAKPQTATNGKTYHSSYIRAEDIQFGRKPKDAAPQSDAA
jgi:single stranded DNA-binding protein